LFSSKVDPKLAPIAATPAAARAADLLPLFRMARHHRMRAKEEH
jgi:hypothetical protein